MAIATTSVWISAKVAVSSELVPNHDSTIDGVMTFECGPISRMEAPSSLTLAINSSSHAATRPGTSSGTVTVRTRNAQEAPHICAHSSRLLSICSMTPAMVRTPSGRNTVMYAIKRSHRVPLIGMGNTTHAHIMPNANTSRGTACGNITTYSIT